MVIFKIFLLSLLVATLATSNKDDEEFDADVCVIANRVPKVSLRIQMRLACEGYEPMRKLEAATREIEDTPHALKPPMHLNAILKPVENQWQATMSSDESVAFMTYATEIEELPPVQGTFVEYLYKNLVVEERYESNIAVSPLSLELMLAALALGADGYTCQEILRVLKVEKDLIALKYNNNLAYADLKQKDSVTVITQIYLEKAFFPVKDEFKNALYKVFETSVEPADFKQNSVNVIKRINEFVAAKTEGHVKNAVEKEDVNSRTELLLVNTLYFKGEWESQFSRRQGFNGEFHLSKHKSVKTTYMSRDSEYSYYKEVKDGKYKMLELPFSEKSTGPFSLIFILPDEVDGLARVEELVTKDDSWLVDFDLWSTKHSAIVKPVIPRFTIDAKIDLKGSLDQMGVREMFEDSAEFPGITKKEKLKVAKMHQRVYLKVGETGTKAATTTSTELKEQKPKAVNFKADHPFAFALIQRETKTVLFMGHVVKPDYDDLFTTGEYNTEEKRSLLQTGMEYLNNFIKEKTGE